MKKVFSYVTALFFSAVLLTSCKKDSTTTTVTVDPGKSDIRLSYSGAASGSFTSNILFSTCAKSTGLINVSGSALSGTSADLVLLVIPVGTTVGAHNQSGASDNIDNMTIAFTKGGTEGWAIGGGGATGFSINITRSDATGIEGTFSGQLGNDTDGTKITVTGGTFKGAY